MYIRCTRNRWLMSDQILPPVNYVFPQKTQSSCFARALCAAHIHIRCQYRTSQIFSNPSIKLCWNKSKKMPRLNNDERKPSHWEAKCKHLSNWCIAALWLYSIDYRAFTETIPCHMKRFRPSSKTVRNWLRRNDQCIRTYRPCFGQILTWCHRTARPDWSRPVTCTSDVLIGIWFCFPMNIGLTLAMPTDAREFIAVVESVLPMPMCHWAGPFRRWLKSQSGVG